VDEDDGLFFFSRLTAVQTVSVTVDSLANTVELRTTNYKLVWSRIGLAAYGAAWIAMSVGNPNTKFRLSSLQSFMPLTMYPDDGMPTLQAMLNTEDGRLVFLNYLPLSENYRQVAVGFIFTPVL